MDILLDCADYNNAKYTGKNYYTEDDILVYNLYVSHIPANINEETLKGYFSRFGDVESVAIVKKKSVQNGSKWFRYGFVNFKCAESAAKALQQKFHSLSGSGRIRVKAADSWKQPIPKEKSNDELDRNEDSKDFDENNQMEEENTSILYLNDDCLLHIFSFLSLKEQLRLSQLCRRFQDIFDMVFRVEKKLNIGQSMVGSDKPLTLMEIRQIILLVGHHIQHVSFIGGINHNNHFRSVEYLLHSCPNLEVLELVSVPNLHIETFRKIATGLRSIKVLKLNHCTITDSICARLSNLPNIETLDLSENCELTGNFLCKFQNLTSLNLSMCVNIQPKFFIELCKNVTSLKSLNIYRCDRLTNNALRGMSEGLINLEELTISTSYFADELGCITEMKSLKKLTIYWMQTLSEKFFAQLVEEKADKLECLEIISSYLKDAIKGYIMKLKNLKRLSLPHGLQIDDSFLNGIAKNLKLESLNLSGCTQITKEGILNLLENSSTIRLIDISLCSQFNVELIYAIIEKLKLRKKDIPCSFIVGGTSITLDILSDEKYRPHRNMVPLSFAMCDSILSYRCGSEDDYSFSDYDHYFTDVWDSEDDDDDFDMDPLDLEYDDDYEEVDLQFPFFLVPREFLHH